MTFWKKNNAWDEELKKQGIKIAILEKEVEIIKIKLRMKAYKGIPLPTEENPVGKEVLDQPFDNGFNELRKINKELKR